MTHIRYPKYPKLSYPKVMLLAILMVLTLVACGTPVQGAGSSPANTPSATTATVRPSDVVTIATATTTPAPPGTSMEPVVIQAVVKAGGADVFLSPTLENVEHLPDQDLRLKAGASVTVKERMADDQWLRINYLGQGGLWVAAERLEKFTASLEQVPVSTQVFATMDAPQQAEATNRSVALTLVAQGAKPADAEATALAMLHPVNTPKPMPFPAITATPPADCVQGTDGRLRCKTAKGEEYEWSGGEITFASLDQLRAVQRQYAQYLDLVMGRSGPPSQDFAAQLQNYMMPAAAVGYVPANKDSHGACVYGDIVNRITARLGQNQYVRITPGGKLVWDRLDWGNGDGYALSYDYTFMQRGHFDGGGTLFEVVDIPSGKVVQTVNIASYYFFEANLVYVPQDNGWRIARDDYCANLSFGGVW